MARVAGKTVRSTRGIELDSIHDDGRRLTGWANRAPMFSWLISNILNAIFLRSKKKGKNFLGWSTTVYRSWIFLFLSVKPRPATANGFVGIWRGWRAKPNDLLEESNSTPSTTTAGNSPTEPAELRLSPDYFRIYWTRYFEKQEKKLWPFLRVREKGLRKTISFTVFFVYV